MALGFGVFNLLSLHRQVFQRERVECERAWPNAYIILHQQLDELLTADECDRWQGNIYSVLAGLWRKRARSYKQTRAGINFGQRSP